ncbi:uncharacterized protein F5147DRAFT_773831 [Suillus discolor]|uniref:Uncharacterized protein n=1 Tax=Suillus discolor TaxID=1912936 RepID=A0A9P7JU35_9AGAM|nr:uncharacterized protein F5147DRAFT_773831 [Suillus discolor]KAG2108247.1 hypothetical protein F5147DRAFT_773831 [Suillus discolor]
MPFPYEVMLAICELIYSSPNGWRHLLPLLVVNNFVSDIALMVLWQELPSPTPLLHLMLEQVVERHLGRNGTWDYALSVLISIFLCHASRSNAPLLPHLTYLRLADSSSLLIEILPYIINSSFQMLILPDLCSYSQPVLSRVLSALPSLRNLAWLELGQPVHDLIKSIHLFPSLHSLKVPLIEDMEPIFLHPSLLDLTVVIYGQLYLPLHTPHFHHPLLSFGIAFRTSLMHGMPDNEAFTTALILLHRFQVPCEQLNISLFYQLGGIVLGEFINSLAALPNPSAISLFSMSDLTHFSVNVTTFVPCNVPPLELRHVTPLYPFSLTHIDLGCFNMCTLDDDNLLSLSLASPQIESLFLGCFCCWSTPPRASLASVSSLLLHCRVLTNLGLVFNCSLGALDLNLLPINKLINTLTVGVTPPYNDVALATFFACSLPNLTDVYLESSNSNIFEPHYISHDRFLQVKYWQNILHRRSYLPDDDLDL